eukprot:679498-Prymnesium_polylepis.1
MLGMHCAHLSSVFELQERPGFVQSHYLDPILPPERVPPHSSDGCTGRAVRAMDNPLPSGIGDVQMVWDASACVLRDRPQEERTEVGREADHSKYIVANPIAVRPRWLEPDALNRRR